ncbi:MAG: hypothetical protein IPP40_00720 [bacterium]|nr:hypothetical protein [bacterium]
MMKNFRRVFISRTVALAGLVMLFSISAWALNPDESQISDPNHGNTALDDGCGACSIDYTGLRYLGTGGQDGRGTIHWPGGSTGNNYGQMVSTAPAISEIRSTAGVWIFITLPRLRITGLTTSLR